jgi:ceramide glucosyltransferase
LAEDYVLGERMHRMGLKVVIMPEPVKQNLGVYSLRTYFNRHLRWGRLRKVHAPLTYLFEPLTMPLVSALCGALAFERYGVSPILFFVISLCFSFGLDVLLLKEISESGLSRRTIPAWIFRESIAFPFWVWTLCGNSINWQGNRLRLRLGGTIESHSDSH